MKQMAEQMEMMMQASSQGGQQEDIESLKRVLDNLLNLSFSQEDLLMQMQEVSINNPGYLELVRKQKNIQREFGIINDSLTALGKRQFMIAAFISKEISSVEEGMKKALEGMEERRVNLAGTRQQQVLTSLNNLALMLSEALNQMQNASNSSCPNGSPKPGGQTPKPMDMKSLRQQLNQQLEQMKNAMQQQKPGGQGKKQDGMSEQLARMAARQRALRQKLQEYSSRMEEEGNTAMAKELKKAAEEMNKTETELVNKMITAETLKRQQEIITRLLESEKAEMEREKDKRRESKEGKNNRGNIVTGKKQTKKEKQGQKELLETVPPGLKYFYKKKVNEYFFRFN